MITCAKKGIDCSAEEQGFGTQKQYLMSQTALRSDGVMFAFYDFETTQKPKSTVTSFKHAQLGVHPTVLRLLRGRAQCGSGLQEVRKEKALFLDGTCLGTNFLHT